MMRLKDRADLYARRFPDYPPVVCHCDWLYGVWMIGACYKRTNDLYGAYPPSYLQRVHSMFPDKTHILHLFSGGLTEKVAVWEANSGIGRLGGVTTPFAELVDAHGPDEGRHPTKQCDVTKLPWKGRLFNLVLVDPPYSKEDAAKYGDKTVPAHKVFEEAHRVTEDGAFLVWLDQKLPMYKKALWKLVGTIGLVRSTNHRFRLVSIFERQG